jgi:hypothetical protein
MIDAAQDNPESLRHPVVAPVDYEAEDIARAQKESPCRR